MKALPKSVDPSTLGMITAKLSSETSLGSLSSCALENERELKEPPMNRQMLLMDEARSRVSFDPQKLTFIIYGSEEVARQRETTINRIETALGDKDSLRLPRLYGNLDRTDLYHDGLAWGATLMADEVQHRHGHFDRSSHRYTLINSSPFGLHAAMFIPTLKLQASPEQLAYWLPLAESGKIIGTYCQTELGHGTFVRGLETTATFNPATDEFIIHSPTTSSTKYWPGGLGYSSSHAIVMARLIVKGKDHGVHPFMTQLRSLDGYKPLPGIELGDIGLKMGLNSTDNGYAIFDQVRIPRQHMMMGNARLSRDGTYSKAPHSKLTYSTMIYTRNLIIHTVSFQLAQAATIAIRYSVVREQGHTTDTIDPREVSIMSYKSQHYRLLSIMSKAFAILFAANACESVYQDLVNRQRQGDHSTLAYGHITTASLKAYCTQIAADGAEDARKCCGGHGYSALSGLPELVSNLVPIATLEGENYVMYQQCARYLMKCASSVRNSQSVDAPMSYLVDGRSQILRGASVCVNRDFRDPDVQLAIFRHRAARLIFDCEELLRETQIQEGLSANEAWNTHMMVLINAARAHIELFVLQSFIDRVGSMEDGPVRKVLRSLCDLFALVSIESPYSVGALGFFEDGYISPSQLRAIRASVNDILSELIPEAVGLTDAWNFSDASLQSALGRKDGNVYETLLAWTRQIPLNREAAAMGGVDRPGFEKYIRPILQAKL